MSDSPSPTSFSESDGQEVVEGPSRSWRSRFAMKWGILWMFWLMAAVGWMCIPSETVSVGGRLILIVCGFTLWKTTGWPRVFLLAHLLVMYLPYLWLFWDWHNRPWHNYRWQWISMIWQLPGFVLAMLIRHPMSDWMFGVTTTSISLLVILACASVVRRDPRWSIASLLILATLSAVNSWFCMAIYRA